ncbi:MAG: DUF4238 domain-containing protein [Thermoanaerobaculia bacterium]
MPEFYLAGFTADGRRDSTFTVFDRDTNTFRLQTPVNTAVSGYYYAVQDEISGERSMMVEKFLGEIEGEVEPVFRKLERQERLTDDDRERLSLFCALLYTRVPQFERSIQEVVNGGFQELARRMATSIEDVRRQHEAWEKQTGNISEVTPEEDFELLRNGGYRFAQPRQNVIKMMLELSSRFAESFLNMRWAVGRAPRQMSLIVTDAPLLLIPPRNWQPGMSGVGLETPVTHKMFPLTRKLALFIGDFGHGFEFLPLTRGQVRSNNLALASRCERFVIGPDEALVRSVVRRTNLAGSTRAPLIVVA